MLNVSNLANTFKPTLLILEFKTFILLLQYLVIKFVVWYFKILSNSKTALLSCLEYNSELHIVTGGSKVVPGGPNLLDVTIGNPQP